jgi:uncharacterized delta-60 repeat protein
MSRRVSLSFCALLALFAMWTVTARAFAAAGDLDPSFSDDGIAEVDFGSHATYNRPPSGAYTRPLGVQPDGDLIIAGYSQYVAGYSYLGYTADPEVAIAAIRADGSLDPAFGAGGKLEGDLGIRAGAGESLLQPDGRILISGFDSIGNDPGIYLARLTDTGQLDSSFSGDGIAPIGTSGFGLSSIALQQDERIVVGRLSGGPPGTGGPDTLALDRLLPDGSADPTFSSGANYRLPEGSSFTAVGGIAIDGNGRLLVSTMVDAGPPHYVQSIALMRFSSDGTIDDSYATGGMFQTERNITFPIRPHVDGSGRAYLWLPPDDSGVIPNGQASELLRLTESGVPDATFGDQGRQTLPPYAAGNGLALLPSGEIAVPIASESGVSLERLLANGTTDSAFNAQAWHPQARCLPTIEPGALGLADGTIVVAGGHTYSYYGSPGTQDRVLVARYLGDDLAASGVSPDPAEGACSPCEDSVIVDCVPYETSISIEAHGHDISGELSSRYDQCVAAEYAAIDRRHGHEVRAASMRVTEWDSGHGAHATYEMTLPPRVSGRVFVRLRAVGDAANCRPAVSRSVVIRTRRHHH